MAVFDAGGDQRPGEKNVQHLCQARRRARVLLYTDDADATADAVAAQGIVPESTVSRRSTLEDVFLRLTGRTLVD